MLSFSERMEQGLELAQVARNRGQHTGKVAHGWNYKRPVPSGLDMIEAIYHTWRKDWQTEAYCAVEYALFADQWEGLAL